MRHFEEVFTTDDNEEEEAIARAEEIVKKTVFVSGIHPLALCPKDIEPRYWRAALEKIYNWTF